MFGTKDRSDPGSADRYPQKDTFNVKKQLYHIPKNIVTAADV